MNLIKEKVRKMQELTTVSTADRGGAYLGGSFSVAKAIQEQVEYEDTIRDAKKPVEAFKVVPPLPDPPPATALALWRFCTGLLP